ncbi:laccase-3 [Oryza brachyantha]|uniref:laccase-3 n=1 Tax=Oryza brachyantha TaxID=4533 RepID=UPI001ADAAF91|nr:laccase-3 [Oryza brachyantha]
MTTTTTTTRLICCFSVAALLLLCFLLPAAVAEERFYEFVVQETLVKRLCKTQRIITVNGQFPGPTIEVFDGDEVSIRAVNMARYNVTLHWHGLRQLRNGWADGPEFVTQCPIRPGGSYTYRFPIQGQEGTLWWHAHSSWLRATVHGALIIHPRRAVPYPFPKPHSEFPIILAEWWRRDPIAVLRQSMITGAPPNVSDTILINGQPGDFLECSAQETSIIPVVAGETTLLRIINAAMNTELFVSLAGHKMTVVAADAMYTKPFETTVVLLGPGQTTDVLVTAHAAPGRYYLAARAYASAQGVPFDNTTATAILQYKEGAGCPSTTGAGAAAGAGAGVGAGANSFNGQVGSGANPFNGQTGSVANTFNGPLGRSQFSGGHPARAGPAPMLPFLPAFNDTNTATAFSNSIRSPAPVKVPGPVTQEVFTTVGFGLFNCMPGPFCQGPNNTRFAASMNNVSFQLPNTVSLLQAHYHHIPGVFTDDFPPLPPVFFDFTSQNVPRALWQPVKGTKLYRVKYGAVVQIVFQDTGIFAAEEHPMHIHGYHFYVLATGFGNYDPVRDAHKLNLVDPPSRNTIGVPVGGWAVVRFVADNPGVWLVHCHIDAHLTGGLAMALLVEDGESELEATMAPPLDLPLCIL